MPPFYSSANACSCLKLLGNFTKTDNDIGRAEFLCNKHIRLEDQAFIVTRPEGGPRGSQIGVGAAAKTTESEGKT